MHAIISFHDNAFVPDLYPLFVIVYQIIVIIIVAFKDTCTTTLTLEIETYAVGLIFKLE